MLRGALAPLLCAHLAAAPPTPIAPPGPAGAASPIVEQATPLARYADGSDSRLALLVTDPDSRWLPLAHGLKSIGVPFQVVTDPAAALRHPVVLTCGMLWPSMLAPMQEFVAKGGTLIVAGEFHRLFQPLLGIESGQNARRMGLDFAPAVIDLLGLTEPEERHLRLGVSPELSLAGTGWTQLGPDSDRLASFEDGAAALVRHRNGLGRTYVFGFSVGTILYRGQSGRDEWFGRVYADAYEPTADLFLRFLAAVYAERNPAAVTLGPVPEGKPLAMLVTHDVDYQFSVAYAERFAEYEHSLGIPATYFLQTKYVRDYLDSAFLDAAALPILGRIKALGHEVGSHSVSHSPSFAQMDLGTGREQFPDYHPSVQSRTVTLGGTILGELRVSKYLIESILPGPAVVSFRPGYLADPAALPQALAATGYRYVSSFTAPNALSNLPFRQNFDRRGGQELELFEFPITFSDGGPAPFTARLGQAQALAEQVARHGGSYVLLIHPNNLEDKFQFEQAFLPPWQHRAWFGTLGGFGQWWEARDRAGVDVSLTATQATIRLDLPLGITGLALRVPSGWSQPRIEAGTATCGRPGEVLVSAPSGRHTLTMAR
jgi:peptidoglycan/xylan/chitin deacetylase (PgdA/CDA1 family)